MMGLETVDWILVADRCRACLLHVMPENIGGITTLAAYLHTEGRLQSHERDSDTPGRIQLRGEARSTFEPHEDRQHVEARRFANELAESLQHERNRGHYDRLFVVAPPSFLGVLREAWPKSVRDTIVHEEAAELMNLPEPERLLRLTRIVAAFRETESTVRL